MKKERIIERIKSESGPSPVTDERPTLLDLQLAEAEWVTNEHDEFIKLIQRYRSLYVTAIFLAFGWVLGQMVGRPSTLEELRSRTDIAALLSMLPLINVLFALLMLEAHAHAADLARYRFLLGIELGDGEAPWRWNIWREKRRSTILRLPTMSLNMFSAALFLLLTGGTFWFSYPALGSSRWLWLLWGFALFVFIVFLITLGIVGLYWIRGAGVVTRPPAAGEQWQELWDEIDSYLKAKFRAHTTPIEQTRFLHNSSAKEWTKAFREWASSHRAIRVTADDSRSSIYDGRGE